MPKYSRKALCLNYSSSLNDFMYEDSQRSLTEVDFKQVLSLAFYLGYEPFGPALHGSFAERKRAFIKFILSHHGLRDVRKLGRFQLYFNFDGDWLDVQWCFYYRLGKSDDYQLFQVNRYLSM